MTVSQFSHLILAVLLFVPFLTGTTGLKQGPFRTEKGTIHLNDLINKMERTAFFKP